MRLLPALCLFAVLPCFFACRHAKAQGSWSSEDVFKPTPGYPFNTGPADDFGFSYAEYSIHGMHVSSHYERTSASTASGISAMEATFKTIWTWNGYGPIIKQTIGNISGAHATLEKGTSVDDPANARSSGGIATVNGITTCSATTIDHTAHYEDAHSSPNVPETVDHSGQETSGTTIHTVASALGPSYEDAYADFLWAFTQAAAGGPGNGGLGNGGLVNEP